MEKNEVINESANVVANNELADVFAYTNLKSAMAKALLETMKFKNAIKVFNGLWSIQCEVGKEKLTLREVFKKAGVPFKGGYVDVQGFIDMWGIKTADGHMAIYRPVTGKFHTGESDKATTNVYAWNEDKKAYETVRIMKLVAVEKWNAALILKGVLQMLTPATTAKQVAKSEEEWADVKDVFVFDKRTEKGSVTNKARAIQKNQVEF